MQSAKQLSFLRNNIGRTDEDEEQRALRLKMEEEERMNESDEEEFVAVIDSDDEWEEMIEDERRAAFQAHYKREMAAYGNTENGKGTIENDQDEVEGVAWEDG